MAPKRSEDQRREMAAFVRWLFAESGAPTWAELARRADVHPVNLSTYQRGDAMPDGWNLYRLIKASGANVLTYRTLEEELVDIVQRLERIEGRLGQLSELSGDALARIAASQVAIAELGKQEATAQETGRRPRRPRRGASGQ